MVLQDDRSVAGKQFVRTNKSEHSYNSIATVDRGLNRNYFFNKLYRSSYVNR